MPSEVKKKSFKPQILVWSDLTLQNCEEIFKLKDSVQTQSYLADVFGLSDFKENKKSGGLVDLYYYTIQFAKDCDFTKEQTSAIFSIIKSVHEYAIDTPYGNDEIVFEYFKELVLCHSVKRPPYSVLLFSVDQVKRIFDYVLNTYFRHYKMYKYVFTPKVRLDLTFDYVGLPVSPEPVQEDESKEDESGEEQAEVGVESGAEEETDKTREEVEDSPAVKELKAMVSATLAEQVEQLKLSIDDQIKASEETLSKKMGLPAEPTPRSPKPGKKKGK